MRFIDLALQKGIRSLAIIGVTKNVGKTVALNYLLEQGFKDGYRLGLASMGRDGEKEDVLTKQAKPSIEVLPGTLVVTAEDALKRSRALLAPVESTGIHTPLGEVYLYEVRRAGNVELMGPHTQKQLQKVVDLLIQRADLTLLDGAINRVLSASPSVSDGAVLSIGASISRSMDLIIKKAQFRVDTLSLPEIEDIQLKERAEKELEKSKLVLLANKQWQSIDVPTSFALGPILKNKLLKTEKLFLGGALTDTVIKLSLNPAFLKKGTLVVTDGTRVFVSPGLWKKYRALGGRAEVLNKINLIALTANPQSPDHFNFDPSNFIENLHQNIPKFPIFDLVAGINK